MPSLAECLKSAWNDIIHEYFPKLELTPPVFILIDSKRTLGEWSGYPQNTISLNIKLLSKPWYALEDVLRHEIAHQLKDVFHPQVQEPPHGPCFKEICKLISADPRAVVEEIDLEERVFNPAARQDDAILTKIKKLLNLGESATDNEAQVALCKARELMLKHGVEQNQLQQDAIVTINLQPSVARRTKGWLELSSLIDIHWPIHGIWSQVPTDDYKWAFFISGYPQDVRIAAYVWDFIKNRVQVEFNIRFKDKGLRKRDLDTFLFGTVCGLHEALNKQNRATQQEGLILCKSPELSQYYKRRYTHIRLLNSSATQLNPDAYKQGKEMGQNMHLSDGIEQKDTKLLH